MRTVRAVRNTAPAFLSIHFVICNFVAKISARELQKLMVLFCGGDADLQGAITATRRMTWKSSEKLLFNKSGLYTNPYHHVSYFLKHVHLFFPVYRRRLRNANTSPLSFCCRFINRIWLHFVHNATTVTQMAPCV